MTLTEAKAVRDAVRKRGLYCTVPLGYGPDGYFARIINSNGPYDFKRMAEARYYLACMLRRNRKQAKDYERQLYRPRSPIEVMIDRACGLPG